MVSTLSTASRTPLEITPDTVTYSLTSAVIWYWRIPSFHAAWDHELYPSLRPANRSRRSSVRPGVQIRSWTRTCPSPSPCNHPLTVTSNLAICRLGKVQQLKYTLDSFCRVVWIHSICRADESEIFSGRHEIKERRIFWKIAILRRDAGSVQENRKPEPRQLLAGSTHDWLMVYSSQLHLAEITNTSRLLPQIKCYKSIYFWVYTSVWLTQSFNRKRTHFLCSPNANLLVVRTVPEYPDKMSAVRSTGKRFKMPQFNKIIKPIRKATLLFLEQTHCILNTWYCL